MKYEVLNELAYKSNDKLDSKAQSLSVEYQLMRTKSLRARTMIKQNFKEWDSEEEE